MPKNREIPPGEKNIVLVGFMGVGKTTVGQLLASELSRDFVDIDLEIEKQFGMPIPAVFQRWGEKKFREAEKNIIRHFCTHTRFNILSLGGGAFMQEDVRTLCLSTCIVLFLDLSFDAWKDRYELIVDSRPVLQGKSWEEIEALFKKRHDIYSYSHSTIQTDGLTPEEIAAGIISALNLNREKDGASNGS